MNVWLLNANIFYNRGNEWKLRNNTHTQTHTDAALWITVSPVERLCGSRMETIITCTATQSSINSVREERCEGLWRRTSVTFWKGGRETAGGRWRGRVGEAESERRQPGGRFMTCGHKTDNHKLAAVRYFRSFCRRKQFTRLINSVCMSVCMCVRISVLKSHHKDVYLWNSCRHTHVNARIIPQKSAAPLPPLLFQQKNTKLFTNAFCEAAHLCDYTSCHASWTETNGLAGS